MAWWTRFAESVRTAGRGDAPITDAVQMARDGLGFDCAALFGAQARGGAAGQPVVVNMDYPDTVAHYISTTYAARCPGHRIALERGVAQRFVDLPFDIRQTSTYRDALGPQGFREGVTLPLGPVRPGESRPAFLAMSSTHALPLDEGACVALTMLAPELGRLVDPAGVPAAPPAGLVLRVSGDHVEVRLGHLADAPLDHVDCVRFAGLAGTGIPVGLRTRDRNGQWWRLLAIPGRGGVTLRMSRTPVPDDLTPRELDVVGLVSRGWSNEQIAAALRVTVRTVRTHIESALAKTGTANRTALTRSACERDLDSLIALAAARRSGSPACAPC
ncbi:LuxR C-terminal-related transcriptional regulator [Gordonia caeni]